MSNHQGEILDLSRLESEELFRTIEVFGYRFGDEGLVVPGFNEDDGSICIFDADQARLIRECVIQNAQLSQKLIDAHDRAQDNNLRYHRPTYSNDHIQRVRESKALCQERIELARVIGTQITKLFNLEEHEYLKADS